MTPVTLTWIDQLKLWWEELKLRLDFSSQNLVQVLVYLSAGFLVGFFLSRYFKSFVLAIFFAALIIGSLHYLQVITIDIVQFKALFGLNVDRNLEWYLTALTEWIKAYPLHAASGFVGFILGFKAG